MRAPELLEGVTAPPRVNGELLFEEPWESRAFGMAVALHGLGVFEWSDFSDRLASALPSRADGSSKNVLPVAPDVESRYYAAWVSALEALLAELGLVGMDELEQARATAQAEDGHSASH